MHRRQTPSPSSSFLAESNGQFRLWGISASLIRVYYWERFCEMQSSVSQDRCAEVKRWSNLWMYWIQGHVFGSRYAEQSQIVHPQWNGSLGPLKLHYKKIILTNNADLVFLLINIVFFYSLFLHSNNLHLLETHSNDTKDSLHGPGFWESMY